MVSQPTNERRPPSRGAREAEVVAAAASAARDISRPVEARLAALQSPELAHLLAAHPLRELVTVEGPYPLYADRPRALFSAGTSCSRGRRARRTTRRPGPWSAAPSRTAAKRLDAVAAMGFDVVYLPPIHPIGEVNRKGPNNTLDPAPTTPGRRGRSAARTAATTRSTPTSARIDDFDAFVAKARAVGLEVALDLALQCAPDHPWVTSHPEWFTTQADGTIAFAENPPKKYQDIYPLNFDNDPQGICREVLRVVRHWMSHGVRIFRVDNPHTKPVAFWEWLLREVRRTDPDVLFLAEAFTRPAMMQTLGAIGFHQSYTYFTWRTAKWEIEEYLREVSSHTDHLMRPNFFVNTPDILHAFLQYGGPAAFKIRAVLAATGSPSWGVYAGYELYEHVAVRPGSEEYLDSEKYQIRVRDWDAAEAEGRTPRAVPHAAQRGTPRAPGAAAAAQRGRCTPATTRTCWCSASESVVSTRSTDGGRSTDGAARPTRSDLVIVVINLDPHGARETVVHLDLPALGLDWHDSLAVHDEITGQDWHWGQHNYVRLDPGVEPAHVLTVRRTA